MNTFAVGEVATFWRPGSTIHNEEVTVTKALSFGRTKNPRGEVDICWHYGIADIHGDHWVAPVEHLRKRRPPQDWVTLCKLDARPVEVA